MGIYLTILKLKDLAEEIKKARGFYEHKGRPGKIGGSQPKNSPHFRSFKDKFRYEIENLVMMHGSAQIEHAHIIDVRGKVIYASRGEKGQVRIPKNLPLTNCHIVHTHPNEVEPLLTPGDIIVAIESNAKSMTATGPTGNYMTIKRPKGGWPKLSKDYLESVFTSIVNDYDITGRSTEQYQLKLSDYRSGKITKKEFAQFYVREIMIRLFEHIKIKPMTYVKR